MGGVLAKRHGVAPTAFRARPAVVDSTGSAVSGKLATKNTEEQSARRNLRQNSS
jgi:hypothetical protein